MDVNGIVPTYPVQNGGFNNAFELLVLLGILGGGNGLFGGRNDCGCTPCSGFSNESAVAVAAANSAGTTALQAAYADSAARALQTDNLNEALVDVLQGQAATNIALCNQFQNVNNNIAGLGTLIQQTTIDTLRSELTQCRANEASQTVISALTPYLAGIQCCCNNVNSKIPCYPILPDSASATLAAALKAVK